MRSLTESAFAKAVFIGFTGNDPRGVTNDPRFDKARAFEAEQRELDRQNKIMIEKLRGISAEGSYSQTEDTTPMLIKQLSLLHLQSLPISWRLILQAQFQSALAPISKQLLFEVPLVVFLSVLQQQKL